MAPTSKGRQRHDSIVETATDLFYRRGYERTSFSDIAENCGFGRGNFYHYFRSKDAILNSVMERRSAALSALFDRLTAESADARVRLKGYLKAVRDEQEMGTLYGCAIGSLAMELAKEDRSLLKIPLQLIDQSLDWLTEQFAAASHQKDPRGLAVNLLCRMQGVTLVSAVYSDREILAAQFEDIADWIDQVFEA